MITPATFILRFPEFTTADPARIQMYINDAIPQMSVARWGNFYDIGMANLVAHMLWSNTPGNAPGQAAAANYTIMKKVDAVQVQYDPISLGKSQDQIYLTSKYGQTYLYYKSLLGPGVTVV